MDKNATKQEQEIARDAVRHYKQQLLETIEGYPDEITHEGLKQILRIVRLEKTSVDDDFRLKICLRKSDDQELMALL